MKTEIIAILDRSGSMQSIIGDSRGGLKNFLDEQRKVAGEARVTATLFDDKYEVAYQAKSVADAGVPDMWKPRGSTALLDAIGRTLNDQGERITNEKWADTVIVVIVTDGMENASREFTRGRIKEMTKHAEKNGWTFIYLGANQDAFAVGQTLGFAATNIATFDANAVGTQSAYLSASATVANLRSGGSGIDLQAKYDADKKRREAQKSA